MILEEITIANWRSFREPHTFRFEQGLNVLVGANEAGKSTLFEALARAFFDRHGSGAEEIKQMRPLGSSQGPEVTVTFEANGIRHKVWKRFLTDPAARLSVERNGHWEVDHENEQADARVRLVMSGKEYSRATKAEHRGLAEALWYLQRDSSLPEKDWSEAVQQGLAGLVRQVVRSPREAVMLGNLVRLYKEHWTPQGWPSSKGELAGLEAEIPALEERADGLRARLEGVQVFRNELEAAQEDQVAKTAALAVSEQRLAEANREVDSAAQFERQAEEKQAKASALKKEVEALVEDLANIERRERVIKEKAQRHPKAEQALRDRRLDMEQEDKRAKAADRLCAEDLHPKLKAVEAEILRYEALGKLRNLEKRQKELDAQATRLKKKRAQVAAQQQKLADITAPSPKEATKFRQLMANARTAQAQADAAAIFVEFKLKGGKGSLESEPPAPVADDGAFLVTEPTRFTLKGVGDMKVWGGGSSLEEARTRLDEAQRETAEQKARFSVQDEAGFEELLQARTRLEAEVKGLVRELEELAGDAAPDDELKQVLKGIKQEEAACKGLPPEALAWGGQRIRTHNEKLQKEKSRLVRELKVKREEAETARDRHSTLAAGHGALVADVAELSTGQQALQEENAETLRKYGTLLRLKGLKVETEEALTAAAKAADEGSKELALRVEAPRALLRQAEAEIKRLTKDIQDSKSTVVDRLARIEQETANGSYTALADLEIQLADRKVRIEVVRRRAEAVKLLNDLVATLQSSETADLAGPISELMASWLALLTGGAYPRLEMVGLVPSGVHVAKYGEALPLVSLSYGMHEQVILLLRLAMGVLLSKSRRELVVLDDRLVNADPVRMKRLCLILTEAAASCQIIISTCNDTPYAGLNAHTLSVPAGGRASEVPLA